MTFQELYQSMLEKAVRGEDLPSAPPAADPAHLDCLLHPEKYAPVWSISNCAHCGDNPAQCCSVCLFGAISKDSEGKITIHPDRCAGCSACVNACKSGVLTASRDVLPALHSIKHAKGPVYALIAPAFHGQFSKAVTPGKLRAAFQALGCTGMVEVALFADILTLKEGLEFHKNIHSLEDYQLTSCCCPVWISMLRKVYHQLMPHVPGAVSPMVAAGRTIKALYPDALTIFIGPCLAKKAEARESDLQGAVDWVLTFQEIRDIFKAANIHPEHYADLEKGHSSRAGRIYARAGGVGEAVRSTVARLHPHRDIPVQVCSADGIPACKAMIEQLQAHGLAANFYEGMGCVGGCVGGPRIILDKEQGRNNVNRYGDEAEFETPLDNPYVTKVLHMLGFETVEDFLSQSTLYERHF